MKVAILIDVHDDLDIKSCKAYVKLERKENPYRPIYRRKAKMVLVPEKDEPFDDDEFEKGWVTGWNECIDEILGANDEEIHS